MPLLPGSIIAAAAKTELTPLGFMRKGRSRLWLADRGTWLNIIEFTPSRWSVCVNLMNAAHWLWASTGFLSFCYAVQSCQHADYETPDQFSGALAGIARSAAQEAEQIDERFATFDAIADFVVGQAEASERMRSSWFGYQAGIVAGLRRDAGQARRFLSGITDERVEPHARPLLSSVDDPDAFRDAVNELVDRQRSALDLPALSSAAF